MDFPLDSMLTSDRVQSENADLIFTTSADLPYNELTRTSYRDDRLNIVFQDAEMVRRVVV